MELSPRQAKRAHMHSRKKEVSNRKVVCDVILKICIPTLLLTILFLHSIFFKFLYSFKFLILFMIIISMMVKYLLHVFFDCEDCYCTFWPYISISSVIHHYCYDRFYQGIIFLMSHWCKAGLENLILWLFVGILSFWILKDTKEPNFSSSRFSERNKKMQIVWFPDLDIEKIWILWALDLRREKKNWSFGF